MNISHKIGTAVVSAAFVASLATGSVLAVTDSRTQTIWASSGDGGVDVIPYIRGTRDFAFVDFASKDFSNISYVYFNLNYNTTAPGTKRGVEGSFAPYYEKFLEYGGVPYTRRQLLFGTCSKNVCTYDPKPTGVKLTVNTKMKTGQVDQYTRVISIAD